MVLLDNTMRGPMRSELVIVLLGLNYTAPMVRFSILD